MVSSPHSTSHCFFSLLLTISAEGKSLAESFGCKFLETSAKTTMNVEKAFYDTVREIRKYNREMNTYSGSALSNGNGPVGKMEMGDDDVQAGCCSRCVLM